MTNNSAGLESSAPQDLDDLQDLQPGPSGLGLSVSQDKVNSESASSSELEPPLVARVPVVAQQCELFPVLYEVNQEVGVGDYGTVYQGIRRSDQLKVAIKYAYKPTDSACYMDVDGYPKPLMKEVALNLLVKKPDKCPNIVEMLDWFDDVNKYILVLEFPHPCMSIGEFIKDHEGHLCETLARDLIHQAIIAAKHCIDHDVFHHDIHVENLLVNTDTLEVKLIDFGLGVSIKNSCERTIAENETVSSLGKVLFEMVTGKIPYAYNHRFIYVLDFSDEFHNLVKQWFFKTPDKLPTLVQLLDHEWFKQGY